MLRLKDAIFSNKRITINSFIKNKSTIHDLESLTEITIPNDFTIDNLFDTYYNTGNKEEFKARTEGITDNTLIAYLFFNSIRPEVKTNIHKNWFKFTKGFNPINEHLRYIKLFNYIEGLWFIKDQKSIDLIEELIWMGKQNDKHRN